MNRIMASRRNSCFEKMDNHPIHTIPNPDLTKMVVLPKTFLQIILAAKWLVHAAFNYVPLVGDELCRPFCIFPSSMVVFLHTNIGSTIRWRETV